MPDARLHVNPTGDLLEATRECEATIFENWFGNTRAMLDEEYAPYEETTTFLSVTDQYDDVVAVIRLIAPGGPNGLKALQDIAGEPWHVDGIESATAAGLDLDTTWEVSTIGTMRSKGLRQVHYTLALYRGLSLVAQMNGMSGYVTILDKRARAQIEMAGAPHIDLPGTYPAPFLGSPISSPVYAIGTDLAAYQRKHSPRIYEIVAHGRGLDGMEIPPAEDFLLFGRTEAPPVNWLTAEESAASSDGAVAQESRAT